MDWIDWDHHLLCPVPTVHPISLYHGRNWTDRGSTKVSPLCYALYLLSILSHCTMGGTGPTGVVPKCPPFAMPCTYCPSHLIVTWEELDRQGLYQSVPFPTAYRVNPIPLYHGRNWTDRGCTKVSHFPPPTGFIPSHGTMGRTGPAGVVPKCPLCYALYLLSIPSHCTMEGTGRTGVVPKCPPFAVPCTYCPSQQKHSFSNSTDS